MKDKNVNNSEKIEAAKTITVEKGKFLTWLDNFWYHYKWPTIVICLFAVILFVCTFQMCSKEPIDIFITYAGPAPFYSVKKKDIEAIEDIEAVFAEYLPDEFSKNRNPYLKFKAFNVMSQEEFKAFEKEQNESINASIDEEGESIYLNMDIADASFFKEELSSFDSWFATGSSYIYFLSPAVYEDIITNSSERLTPLSEVFEEIPAEAVDDFGIVFGQTNMYKDNPELHAIPSDTIICLQKPTFWSKDSDYNKGKNVFVAYVTAPKNENK